MKILLTSILFLAICSYSHGQDGSDIRYFKVEAIDSSLIGQFIHLDFYRRSFGGRAIDTITINIKNKPVRFIENRKDNGFNNWFSEQSLVSIDDIDGIKAKIASWVILDISKDSILVKPNFELIIPKETLFIDAPFKNNYWFDKKIIKEILVKSKQYGS